MTKTIFYEPGLAKIFGRPVGGEQASGGAYEGADRTNRALASFPAISRSADADLLPQKATLDARSRHLGRNDAYVQAGAKLHQDTVVGGQFLLGSDPSFKALGLDETWAEEFQEEVEEKFQLAADSPRNWFDAMGVMDFTAMVRLAVGVGVYTGEYLGTVEWLRDDSSRPFKTAIQSVDLDRLSNPNNQPASARMRGGVERTSTGRPIAYHIRDSHPGDFGLMWDPFKPNPFNWKRVAARKPWGRLQVIHCYEGTRPDQSRGVSELVSAMKEMHITSRFRELVLQSAAVQASFAASIESELPTAAIYEMLGAGNVDSMGQAVEDYASSYMSAIEEYAGAARNIHIDGARIPHLFPGTKMHVEPLGTPGGVGTDFEKSLIRYIASALGVDYESLSKDFSQSNYSSARAGMLQTYRANRSRKRFFADYFATSVFWLWLEEMINANQITSMPRNAPSIYEGTNLEAYGRCTWIGAGYGQIDELKETQAAAMRVRNNLSTYEDEFRRMGLDYRRALRQRGREQKMIKELGLEVEPKDNALNAASGSAREKAA